MKRLGKVVGLTGLALWQVAHAQGSRLDTELPIVPLPVLPADPATIDPLEITSSGVTLIDDLVGQIDPDLGAPFGPDLPDVLPAAAFIERLATPLPLPGLDAPPVIAQLSALTASTARSVLASQCVVFDRSERLDFGQINQYSDRAETTIRILLRCPQGHSFRIAPEQNGTQAADAVLRTTLVGEVASSTTAIRLTSEQIPLGAQAFKGTGALQQIPVSAELLIPGDAPRPSRLQLDNARLVIDFDPDSE